MLYINEKDIKELNLSWDYYINIIAKAVASMMKNEYTQPLKPYLRYKNMENRIIAMPAYIGGDFNVAGIKWIASFPNNINIGIPRAHSVTILNNADTGEPLSIFNAAFLSIVRTASVSGLVIKEFIKARHPKSVNIGIVGFGPIGRSHLDMAYEILGDKILNTYIYDINGIDDNYLKKYEDRNINIMNSWEDVYGKSDIFITCTTSKKPYIDKKPLDGSLLINVSLRDYKLEVFQYVKNSIIIDDWDEVCRENTDIEKFHQHKGLSKNDVKTITEMIFENCISNFPQKSSVMFNPMGMAIFDIAIAASMYSEALKEGIGTQTE